MPNWLWPTTKQDGSRWAVRLGRLLHYVTLAWAVAVVVVGILVSITEEFMGPVLFAPIPVYLLGRGLRYLLANE